MYRNKQQNRIIKEVVLVTTIFLLSNQILFSQEDSIKKSVAYLGLWPKVSTNGKEAGLYNNRFSFNLIYANSLNETGFAFSGLGNLIERNATGVQISGLGHSIMNDGNGLAIAGLFNIASNTYRGLQITAGWNNTHKLHGVQIGGFNTSLEMKGIQTGFSNATEDMNGLQVGFVNISEKQNGLQIGLLNENKEVNGVQIGLVNIADSSKYFIGIVNILKNGKKGISLTYDEMMNAIVSFRSGTPQSYGIVGLGYNFQEWTNRIAIELGIGRAFFHSPRFHIKTELAITWMSKAKIGWSDPDKNKKDDYDHQPITRTSFRIIPTLNISPKIRLFAGPTLNYMYTKSAEAWKLFPDHSIWKKESGAKLRQLYFGYLFGLQYTF